MQDQKEALRQAVVTLVTDPSAEQLFDSLAVVLKVARVHPVRLTGSAEVLNPLLDLSRDNPAAYERVMALVDSKRVTAGLSPLVPPPAEEKFDKAEYMREFMDQKRRRQRRAVELENMERPERDRLIGRARLDFMDVVAARWKSELDTLLQRARQSISQRLPRDQLDAIRSQFWASVDAKLDEQEQAIRERMRRKP